MLKHTYKPDRTDPQHRVVVRHIRIGLPPIFCTIYMLVCVGKARTKTVKWDSSKTVFLSNEGLLV